MIAMEPLKSFVNELPAASYITVATPVIVYLGEMPLDDFRDSLTLTGDGLLFGASKQFFQDELVSMFRYDRSLCEFP